MARVLWRLLPSLVVLLGVLRGHILLVLLRALAWTLLRLIHVAVLVAGGVSVWAMLRSWQLGVEQEIYDSALLKHRFYEKYRRPGASGISGSAANACKQQPMRHSASAGDGEGILDAGFQLRVVKRLPVVTHLRTSWSLAPEICDEIATFVTLAVRDYVSYWFQPISPHNDDFPHDIKFLLADMMGAIVARVLEIDSSQALTMAAKCIELLRLHLGWFREAYATLAEEHPLIFQGEESDANLLKRQELVAAYVQKAKYLHPGCVTSTATASTGSSLSSSTSSTAKKPQAESAEVLYLRHIATQLLVQLKPELGQQSGSNLFVSIAFNLMRESVVFKALKPMVEYSQPRYANEVIVAALTADDGAVADSDKEPSSPNASADAVPSTTAPSSTSSGVPNLKTLRMTTSFLYKASKRSSEQAEAALQAVFDVVSTAASQAGISSGNPASPTSDLTFDGDFWAESAAFGIVSPRSPTALPASPPPQPTPSNERKTSHFASIFSLDDRISFPKSSRLMTSRMPLSSGSSSSTKASSASITSNPSDSNGTTHMEDLKSMKANLESSLNSSLFKVKKTFKNLGGHLQDPFQSQIGMASTTQAASLMKRPGKLFQKALRRPDTTTDNTPLPVSPDDFPSTPPPLGSCGFGDPTESSSDSGKTVVRSPTQPFLLSSPAMAEPPSFIKEIQMQDRVLLLLEKTTANYVKLFNERAEMRSSARSRELYELLSALEDVFMLGYRRPGEGRKASDDRNDEGSAGNGARTPPGSPSQRRSIGQLSSRESISSSKSMDESSAPVLLDPGQLYWNYLAQERPETPFLNDHWRFVDAHCPMCADSESFYSTRGLQWILIALEKGMLWEYVTALHLNRRLTEQFYDEIAVLRNGKLMEKVLKNLFQLNKLHVSFEIPHVLGRSSDLEKEFGVSRAAPVSAAAQVVRIVETSWEVERYVPLQGWAKSQDKRSNELPSSEWIWENEWTLEPLRDSVEARTSALRRSGSAGSDSSDVESGMWEYGKALDDRFHDKEKKLDSVRRRKWTRRRRQLPPVLSLPVSSGSFSSTGTTPRSSTTASLGFTSVTSPPMNGMSSPRRQANRLGSWDSEEGELAVQKTASAKLNKRRSFSLDKTTDRAELDRIAEVLSSPKPRLSGGLGGWRRKKRGSCSPIKRTTGAQQQEGKKGRGVKSPTLSDDELTSLGATFADETGEDDDDGNMCFRCFHSIAGARASVGKSDTCQSCHQRVCASCHDFYAFLVYPPPLESSMKEQVCGSCYERYVSRYKLKVEAHVGKYFIREKDRDRDRDRDSVGSDSSATASTGGAATANAVLSPGGNSASTSSDDVVHRFEVTVQLREESSFAWSVVKSFQDFEQLEKQLSEKLKKQEKKHGVNGSNSRRRHWRGVDYAEMLGVEPPLKQFASAPYERKLFALEAYLQRLLNCDTLCQSSVVQKFLLLGENLSGSGVSANIGEPGDGVVSGGGILGSGGGLNAASATGGAPASGSSGGGNSSMVMVENGRWKRGKWIAPEANSKETKMRVLQKLEVSLFAVLNEVFEFDGIGMLRRHLFSMTRSFIKAFLSASHFRKLEKQYLTFTDPKKMAASLYSFRLYMFPDPAQAEVPLPPAQLSAAEMQALRKKSLEAILASFPSTIVSVFGDASSANAALKLHEFLQHEIFLKNLLFSISDELLPFVFPDVAPYTPKANKASSAATKSATS